ncbi:MAG TPA: (2Fe-2S)-binding protein [Usitatibacter sp.]|nr:(2Fe-2S)-binding protein [Usitatibacter sp.]
MKMSVAMTVNGKPVSAEIEARTLLVEFIREKLLLTGTHVGCDTAQCGACTILVDGKAVKSCNMLAIQAHNAKITTIEGLAKANGDLHPMQEAFRQHHGLQCGFCTPGMVMSAVGLAETAKSPTEAQIRDALDGNFCRCTGYHNIVKAVKAGLENMA